MSNKKRKFGGEFVTHSLYTHAKQGDVAYVTYQLDSRFDTFEAIAGVWETAQDPYSPLVFSVVGDDKVLWTSRLIQKQGDGQQCKVDITGVDVLTLAVRCGDNASYAHTAWIYPHVIRDNPSVSALAGDLGLRSRHPLAANGDSQGQHPDRAHSPPRPIDLLAGIDPSQDSFNGAWRIEKGKLLSPIAKHTRIRIPFSPPPEYRIEMVVEPLDAKAKTLVLGLVTEGPRKFAAAFDCWQGKKNSGLEFVDGKQCFENVTRFVGPVLTALETNRIVCTVRPEGVVVSVNGGEIINWQGDPQRLSMERKWDIPDASALSVGAYESPFIIHSMTLTPLGKATEPLGSSPTIPVADGLVAHWTFDEGRGSVARDAVGGHHGAIEGATWIDGVRGGALALDGVDDVVEIPLADALNIRGRITLAAWVRAKSLRTKRGDQKSITSVLSQGNKDGTTFLRYIDRGEGPSYSSGAYQPGKPTQQAMLAVPSADVGQWVHLVGVYDGGAWRLYRGGRLVASENSDLGAQGREMGWLIGGADDENLPLFFDGDIDDVRIYNRALSAEEVAALAEE